jgi:endonuclease/exonuclease/phosphatase family metal-dependent hydrolase
VRRATRVIPALLLALLVLLPGPSPAQPAAQAPVPVAEPVSVMSFNIRYGNANDGENRWALRREALFALMRSENADVIGLQEALHSQILEILAAVPGYAVAGVGRDDGKTRGEFSAILFRTSRFTVSDAGTFWFSDTPEVVASRSWGNTITRICSWARLLDRDGRAFWLYNVHLDHQSQPSRERSTALLMQRITTRAGQNEPVVVTGDLNVGESNPALVPLVGTPASPGQFVDTFRVVHPDAADVGTFTGFDATRTSGDKIDYVFAQRGTEVLSAAIVRTSAGGRTPSDHFPVTARLRFR